MNFIGAFVLSDNLAYGVTKSIVYTDHDHLRWYDDRKQHYQRHPRTQHLAYCDRCCVVSCHDHTGCANYYEAKPDKKAIRNR